MPFENFSDNPDQDFLADGLPVNIHDALTKVSGVFRVGMGSAMSYGNKSTKLPAREMGFKTVESNA
jgi:TolB-like protein